MKRIFSILFVLLAVPGCGKTTVVPQNQMVVVHDKTTASPRLTQQAAAPTPYARYWFSSDAVSAGFGASTEANLASQLADPVELAAPQRTGSPNPVAAAGAVERYQKGEVRALREQEIEAGKVSE